MPTFDANNPQAGPIPNIPPKMFFGPSKVSLNPATTYESPFFWLIIGFAGGLGLCYAIRKGKI